MWVNISDSLLSVILVWLLIPRMGIMGYAVVIVIMEGYNFLLSFIRLRKKITFSLMPIRALILPFIAAFISTALSGRIFRFCGSTVTPLWLIMKMLFALAITVFFLSLFYIRGKGRIKKTA